MMNNVLRKIVICLVVGSFVIGGFCKMFFGNINVAMAESADVSIANEMSNMGESSNLDCCLFKINNESGKSPEIKMSKEVKEFLKTSLSRSAYSGLFKNRMELQFGFNYLNNLSAPPKLTGQVIKKE